MSEKKDKCCKEDSGDSCCCSGGDGHGKKHEHGHDHEHVEMEDVVYNNNVLLGTLIGLLIKKKVITEEEFTKELQRIEKEEEEGSEDSE
jgi:hypothetical protein